MNPSATSAHFDSGYSWRRLIVGLLLSTLGGIGLWSPVVILPTIQAEFGVDRGDASLPYTMTMIACAIGGALLGRLADRVGIMTVLILGALMLGVGYVVAAGATSYWHYVIAQGLLIGLLGSSSTFAPLMAEISLWFRRHRGIAVAIVASGNYLAGTIWPPVLHYAIESVGWRQTHFWIGILCVVTMLPLALLFRRRAPRESGEALAAATSGPRVMPASPAVLQGLLLVAGIACCVAMSMPQVHMIAYCGDLGYGPARGAEMLSLMLGFGVISRLTSGLIADRIGGLCTLLLGSTLQCLALLFYLPFDGLTSLYVIAALFGLSQGGIVPSYALIVRDYFPAKEAGARIGLVLMATIVGMALGGWMSGEIFDLTGSYEAAFLNGIAWNLLNMGIVLWLLLSSRRAKLRAA